MSTSLDERTRTAASADGLTQVRPRLDRRVMNGMRERANWFQLLRFGTVGASGYVVNLIVFWVVFNVAHTSPGIAATCAFIVALTNNFFWNRIWTFGATAGHAGFQAARFFTISVLAFLFSLGVLELLVHRAGVSAMLAQATALVLATPLNFLGNRWWSFRL